MDVSRRSILKGAAGLALAPAFAGVAPPRPFLVVVNLVGGNDGLNTLAPVHLAPYHERRRTLAIAGGLAADGRYAFHPRLARLKQAWDAGELHAIHRVGYPDPNLSHFASMDVLANGVRAAGGGDGRGWLGRLSDAYCRNPFGVVAVGVGRVREVESASVSPLVVGDLDDFRIRPDPLEQNLEGARRALLRRLAAAAPEPGDPLDARLRRAFTSAYDAESLVASKAAAYEPLASFPNESLARSLRTVARLVAADLGTRVYYTAYSGFDTHAEQGPRHDALLGNLDAALGAFRSEMKARGRWGDCVILVVSEFGRRNYANGSGGTDHGHGNLFLALGGAVRGGR